MPKGLDEKHASTIVRAATTTRILNSDAGRWRGTAGPVTPRVTGARLAGAAAVLVGATAIMYLVGVDMRAYLTGAVAGIAIAGAVVALMRASQRRRSGPPMGPGDR